MTLVEWLLAAVCALLVLLALQLAAVSSFLRTFVAALGNDLARAQNSREEIANSIADCANHLDQVRDAVPEITEVMKIIEEYKLPSSRERKELDELAFEAEHLRRVAEALAGKSNADVSTATRRGAPVIANVMRQNMQR